jgi:hypothetical protein
MFSKPIRKITFMDIVSFCAKKNTATAQLNYLPLFKVSDLPRHIAALANTFGGYIIIGVSPDAETSQPRTWKGIRDGVHIMEQLERAVSAVAPYPHCAIHKTTSKGGRVFLIIHVQEGRYGPYHVINEPHTVWVRYDGQVPLLAATRNDIMHIREKHTQSERHMQRVARTFSLLHDEAEISRQAARTPDDDYSVYMPGLLESMPLLTMYIRPRYLVRGLLDVHPQTLRQLVPKLRPLYDSDVYTPHFPESDVRPMPDGVVALCWYDGQDTRDMHCDQLYTDGTVYHAHSVLQYVESEPAVYLTTIAMELYDFLTAAATLYTKVGYRGALEGSIEITQASGLQTVAALPLDCSPFPSSLRTIPFADHAWEITTDTHKLTDLQAFLSLHLSLMERIHWDMRASSYSQEQLHTVLWQAGRTKIMPPTLQLG